MKFLFPTFLFALATIAIPIIIHLFNFRRFKTVYFSNVEFLKKVKKEANKKSKLKQLLILISRILAIIFMVLAFSQPFIPADKNTNKAVSQAVAIYVDNSFSMNSQAEQGQLLDIAKNKAHEISKAYKPGTKFMLVTNGMLAKHKHVFNKDQLSQQISEITASPNVVNLSRVYNQLQNSFAFENKKINRNLYLISDFQKQTSDIESFEADTSLSTYLLPLSTQTSNNIYIDSCWFETPARKINQEEELFVKIVNRSGENYQNLPLKLYINDSLKALGTYNINANNEVIQSLKFTNTQSGNHNTRVEITDYPVTFDNNYFLSYTIQPELKILAVYDPSEINNGLNYLKALFDGDDYIKMETSDYKKIQINQLGYYNCIVLLNIKEVSSGLMSALNKSVSGGSSLVFFPHTDGNISNYNQLISSFKANTIINSDTLEQELSGINYENIIFQNVFKKLEEKANYSKVNTHFRYTSEAQIPETNLLWFRNNHKALSSLQYQNGKLYTFSFPLNTTNSSFVKSLLFVPTLYNIVLNSIPQQPIAYLIGKDQFISIKENGESLQASQIMVQNSNTDDSFIASIISAGIKNKRINTKKNINEAGFYSIKANNKEIKTVAFNYNRNESDLSYYTDKELKNKLIQAGLSSARIIPNTESNFSEIFEEIQNGKQLWQWFIIFALVFILAEALIIRFWK